MIPSIVVSDNTYILEIIYEGYRYTCKLDNFKSILIKPESLHKVIINGFNKDEYQIRSLDVSLTYNITQTTLVLNLSLDYSPEDLLAQHEDHTFSLIKEDICCRDTIGTYVDNIIHKTITYDPRVDSTCVFPVLNSHYKPEDCNCRVIIINNVKYVEYLNGCYQIVDPAFFEYVKQFLNINFDATKTESDNICLVNSKAVSSGIIPLLLSFLSQKYNIKWVKLLKKIIPFSDYNKGKTGLYICFCYNKLGCSKKIYSITYCGENNCEISSSILGIEKKQILLDMCILCSGMVISLFEEY